MARLVAGEAAFIRKRVLAAVAGTTAFIYATLLLLAPAHESAWGRNSSLKPVVAFLHQQGAAGIHIDHFSPSLEFYWGEQVRYTGITAPIEIEDKVDEPDEHFESADPLIGKGDWFIHYQDQTVSPFNKWIGDPRIPKTYIGDFVVGPLQ
jgi:hypothetical protein